MRRHVSEHRRHRIRGTTALAGVSFLLASTLNTTSPESLQAATGDPVQTWDEIAANTVVKSGAFQNEGLIYMAYVSAAVYDAVVAIEGGFAPLGPPVTAPRGASVDAAVIEAAYDTLVAYFPAPRPAGSPDLDALHAAGLAEIPDSPAKAAGIAVGAAASHGIVARRARDGRLTPIGVSSSFRTRRPGPGVWRLTPPAFAAPQTPWVATVQPFVLPRPDRFRPKPPPSLGSNKWERAFDEITRYGSATSTVRTVDQTNVAKFWTANVILQYNRALRDVAGSHGFSTLETARLMAMVNIVGADAQIAVMDAKYHYLFWRPVTAINPSAVTNDGFGPTPGFDDGNPATAEIPGWLPLLTTPNHPEYPAAHGSLTSAMAAVFVEALGTERIDVDIHGFDPAGAVGNLDAVRHFATAADLDREIVDARLWGGLHYRFSGKAGVKLGGHVARYDLTHAFGTCRPRLGDD
jgi:hypothetical protein